MTCPGRWTNESATHAAVRPRAIARSRAAAVMRAGRLRSVRRPMRRPVLRRKFLGSAVVAARRRSRASACALLAAGPVGVIGYGLSGRLAPGVVTLHRSASAGGRLEQPLTYWNATGSLAAIGFVLCARLAGEPSRPRAVRCAAAAGAVPLATGVYLSFSRGALAALA